MLRLVLLAAGALSGYAARIDAVSKEQNLVSVEADLLGLRAFNETELRMLIDGADLPLVASSFAETDFEMFDLPRQWRSKLEIVKKIGEGSFGKVFKCKVLCDQSSGKDKYASLKLITQKTPAVMREVRLLEKMAGVSDYCISAMGSPSFLDTPEGYWVLMPYMNGGELLNVIRQCRQNPACGMCRGSGGRRCWAALGGNNGNSLIMGLFYQVVRGVDAFHKRTGMLHLDLKPNNIMIHCSSEGRECHATVIDVGIACDPKKPRDCGQIGTPGYMPREVYAGSPIGMKSVSRDVFALGVILYQLVYQRPPPFMGSRTGVEVKSYRASRDPNLQRRGDRIDKLVQAMLDADYNQRPGMSEVESTVKDIIEKDYATDTQAQEMVTRPEHSSSSSPPCLGRTGGDAAAAVAATGRFVPFTGDLGDKTFNNRRYCSEMPTPGGDDPRCASYKRANIRWQCCKCNVKTHGKMVSHFYARLEACF